MDCRVMDAFERRAMAIITIVLCFYHATFAFLLLPVSTWLGP